MAVYYQKSGNGLLENVLGPLALVSSFVPGLQPVVTGLGAANAALNGDYAGAAKQAAGLKNGGKTAKGTTAAPVVETITAEYETDPYYAQRKLSALNGSDLFRM